MSLLLEPPPFRSGVVQYSTSLEALLEPVNALVDNLEEQYS